MAIEKASFRQFELRLPGWFAISLMAALILVAGGVGALLMAQFERTPVQVQLPATVPVASTPNAVPVAAVDTVTVVGEGRVAAAPDTMFADLGAEVLRPDVPQALAAATSDATKLTAALKTAGVAPADIQTTGLSTNPKTDYYNNNAVLGYYASTYLRVRIRDTSKATAILSAAAGAIGNDIRFNSLQLTRLDTATQATQARQAALTGAASKAGEIANLSNRKLGHITDMREQFVGYVSTGGYAGGGIGAGGGGGAVSVPQIVVGQGEVVVQLVVTYSLS